MKPIDKRAQVADLKLSAPYPSENEEAKDGDANGGGGGSWSFREDIALLNALKAFPKDGPMRWEKISAAVPAGRSKAALTRKRMPLGEEGEEGTKKTLSRPSRRRRATGGGGSGGIGGDSGHGGVIF
ncbi:hypothetical protein Taro_038255 [Colocasia esculenta]|uniref:Myb-like domain-containing protein n=1 Tax=Colocasia esculenta TaxID=4460 RepID=A0A843W2X0_COLES|nr:hypothetical protein [Colocasia esculenta]